MSKPTVIVYGATSYTGKELLNYFDSHPQNADFDVILSGRNSAKLQAAAKDLNKRHETVTCQLNSASEVKELVSRGRVVINLAGPFGKNNAEALIRECASTGKHYVDLTGESHWLATEIIPKYHYLASKTGACIVPSCGFDSVPSDMLVYLALRTLQDKHPDASITDSASYFKIKTAISGGTFESMREVAKIPRAERKTSEWQLVGNGSSASGPQARPKLWYELVHPALAKPLIGCFFVMFPFNRCIVRRSWSLSRSNPQSTSDRKLARGEGKEPVHGGGFIYEEAMVTGSRATALLGTAGLMLFAILFFGFSWTRWVLNLFLPKAGTGVSHEQLLKGFMDIVNVSQTTEEGIEVITTCKAKGDPGYIVTNYLIAESALSLVLPPPKGHSLPPLSQLGGVLTPSTAFGTVLIERLRQSGKVSFESKLYESAKRR